MEALTPAAPLLRARIVGLSFHPHARLLGQQLHGLLEVERLRLLHELEGVSTLATAEAVVELVLGIHRKRGRALVVERAEPGPTRAHPSQIRLLAHQLDHVHGLAHPVDRVLCEQRHQNPCGTDSFSNSRIA